MDEDPQKTYYTENCPMKIPIVVDVVLYLSLALVVQFRTCHSHQPLLSPQLGRGALRHAGWAISLRWQSDAIGGAKHAAVAGELSTGS